MKNEAGNIHQFKTKELYDLIGHRNFGELLTKAEIEKLTSKEVLDDYVDYKLHVYRGENPQ